MNIKLIFDLYQKRNPSGRNIGTWTLLQYYIRLKTGEITRRIYKKNRLKSTGSESANMRVIDDYIRKSLIKIKISNLLDVEKKIGFENIGIGCLITPALFGNLIAVTQGEASFYFPTKIKEKHVLKISLLSIPKISGIVKFEDKPIHHFSISTLSEHNVSVEISPELVKDNLSKISISTNRHWSSKYLDKNLPDFPLGVAVRSIELASQF